MKARPKSAVVGLVATVFVVAVVVVVVVLSGGKNQPRPALLPNGQAAPAPVIQPATKAMDLREARTDVGQVQKALNRYRAEHGSFRGLTARTIAAAAPKASFQLMYAKGKRVCAEIERGDQILHVSQTGTGPGICPRLR